MLYEKNPFTLLIVFVVSCSKETGVRTNFYNLPQPIQDMIADAKENCPTWGIYVAAYKYHGKVIYGSVCRGILCSCAMIFYDSNGERIKYDEAIYTEINAHAKLIKELYRCVD